MLHPILERQIENASGQELLPEVADQLWRLAAADNNVPALVTLVTHASTPFIRGQALLRKEAPIRVAYLCAPGTAEDERSTLLEKEKRSEVFAGLVEAASGNEKLVARLAAQFKEKPTKALAKAMLRGGFKDADTLVDATILMSNSSGVSDTLAYRMTNIVRNNATDAKRRRRMVKGLAPRFLLELAPSTLDSDEIEPFLDVVEPVALTALGSGVAWDLRNQVTAARRVIVELCGHEQLSPESARRILALSENPGLDTQFRDRIGTLLLTRGIDPDERATSSEICDRARVAVGSDLDEIIRYATEIGESDHEVVVALLRNPALPHAEHAGQVIGLATQRAMLAAVRDTKSIDLVKLMTEHARSLPDGCLEHFEDPEAAAVAAINHLVSCKTTSYQAYNAHSLASDLLQRYPTKRVISQLGWPLLHTFSRGWSGQSLVRTIHGPLQELMLEKLGTDPHHWQQFNVLAAAWDGSVEDLLATAAIL